MAILTRGLAERIERANAGMYPGYFALVMATGIVSTALFLEGVRVVSQLLLWINLAAYPVLIAATARRGVRYGAKLWADLSNPQTVFTFFTFVAASDVLGVQLFLRGYRAPALGLWLVALIAWLFLGYFSFGVLVFTNTRSATEVLNASWLIAVVGTQSIAVLGALLAPDFGPYAQPVFMAVYGLWGIGIALYGIFITLIAYRLFFARLDPGEMLPPYWIILGATAISALAGTNLVAAAPQMPFLAATRPLLMGVTLLLWAWSSWWIPMLALFGLWRHGVHKVPLTYHPAYWSLVFPLGMYTVATYRLAAVLHLPALKSIPAVMVWVALLAWGLTALGLIRSFARGLGQGMQIGGCALVTGQTKG
ncbi:MAG TPA: tellurite resistance/C4-dicarboxylate transporter family protein [Chthonomonadaceae bacterium]|nr:tellurite resistance/C4-dicarboxylate transporter family protein [Chthonomonadaceae bacterium]